MYFLDFRALFAAACIALATQAFAQQPPKPAAAAPSMPVKAATAKTATAVEVTNAVGTLRADEAITLKPEIAGRIVEFHFSEGQNVARGSKLVSLDSSELAAVLAGSTSDVTINKQRVERSEDLFRKGFISQQALEDARSNLAKSVARQREDQARLARTELRAPFSGVMGLRQVSEGAYVAAGTEIARLEKIDRLKLDFRVPETYLSKVRSGQKARVAVDAYRGQNFSATLYAIEPGVDEATRTVLVRARVANADLKLRPGMYARVVLQLGERANAIWIPEQAIVPRGQESYVFRIVAGKVDLVRVQTGLRKVGEVEIVKGLAAGDLVVTEGVLRLGPGTAVSVMQDAPPKPPAASKDAPAASNARPQAAAVPKSGG